LFAERHDNDNGSLIVLKSLNLKNENECYSFIDHLIKLCPKVKLLITSSDKPPDSFLSQVFHTWFLKKKEEEEEDHFVLLIIVFCV
jgi:hypothetical protein